VHLGYYRRPISASLAQQELLDERPNVDMAERVVSHAPTPMSSASYRQLEPRRRLYESLLQPVTGSDRPGRLAKSDKYYGWAKIANEALASCMRAGGLWPKAGRGPGRIGAPREIDASNFKDKQRLQAHLGAYISCARSPAALCPHSRPSRLRSVGRTVQLFYGVSDNTRRFWSIRQRAADHRLRPEDDRKCATPPTSSALLIGPAHKGRLGAHSALTTRQLGRSLNVPQ